MKEVVKPSDIPNVPHFALQLFENHSVHHEGDERSRTNPGHGYPAYTENFLTIRHYVTLSESEWKEKINSLFRENIKRTDVKAFTVDNVASLKVEVSVM